MSKARSSWLHLAFAGSGIAGLIYETVLQRELARTFGVTAWATATVLAAYMGGMALGALLFGGVADCSKRPLWLYAALELGIGLCALLTPAGAHGLTWLFVHLAHGADPSSAGVAGLRFALATVFSLVPTVLMGATLPAITRGRAAAEPSTSAGREVGWLYALNLIGASAGAALATYAAMPHLGLIGTLVCGAALNAFAAAVAFTVGRSAPTALPTTAIAPPAPLELDPSELASARTVWVLAAWSGFASFAFEVVWTHLLAIVVGSSAYAFGLMLALFLAGLALASWRVARRPPAPLELAELGAIQLVVAAVVAGCFPFWDHVQLLFALAGPHVAGFAGRELIRAAVCLPLITLPAYVLGLFYPLLLRHATEGAGARIATTVGRVTALNTLGSVVGALGTGFLLLPHLGSRATLLGLVLASCAVAAFCLRRSVPGLAGAVAVAGLALMLPAWNMAWLGAGSNVYFDLPPWALGTVRFAAESVQSGLTTVVEQPPGKLTLLSNGKFQGDNGFQRTAQLRFAQVPLLFAHGAERALVVGAGTGESVAVMAASPFKQIDVAELSSDILDAARTWFSPVNHGVFKDPKVHVKVVDGRNLLLLTDTRYDLITLELSSIWIAGEADLYNREFYRLARDHLAPAGVLQQWVQLHHMRPRELAMVLNTVRHVFPHVVLFVGGGQGQIVASEAPLALDYAHIEALSRTYAHTPVTEQLVGGDLLTLQGELVLDEPGLKAFVAEQARAAGLAPEALVSTDDNLALEYATPRNNVLGPDATHRVWEALKRFPPGPLPTLNADTPAQVEHVSLARAVGTGTPDGALLHKLDAALARGVPVAPLQAFVKAALSEEVDGGQPR